MNVNLTTIALISISGESDNGAKTNANKNVITLVNIIIKSAFVNFSFANE